MGSSSSIGSHTPGATRSIRPLAFEEVVYEAERLASAAYVLSIYLEGREEPEAQQTAVLLTDALERQAAALRLFMDTPDDPR